VYVLNKENKINLVLCEKSSENRLFLTSLWDAGHSP